MSDTRMKEYIAQWQIGETTIGEIIALSDQAAKRLLALGAVRPLNDRLRAEENAENAGEGDESATIYPDEPDAEDAGESAEEAPEEDPEEDEDAPEIDVMDGLVPGEPETEAPKAEAKATRKGAKGGKSR